MTTTGRAAVHTPSGKPGLGTAHVVLVLGLLATALVYLDTLSFQFVYDDVTLIVRNPQVQSWSNLAHFFTQHLWAAYAATGNYYRPIYQLWLLLNYTAFGMNPLGWHVTTVAVHLGATSLVYVLLARLGTERLTAAIAATLFGVHPVHIESVAWVSGVIDPLAAVFFLGALICHLRAREGKRWCLGPALVLCVLALLTKEAAAVLPGVVLVLEWTGLRRGRDGVVTLSRTDRLRSAVTWMLPYAAVAVLYVVARHYVLAGIEHPEATSQRALWLTLPAVLSIYVRHLVWPQGLAIFYHLPLVTKPGLENFAAPLAVVVLSMAVLLWAARRSRLAAFAGWWMALLMVPPIAGLPVFPRDEIVHDRYLYLASVGFTLLVALGIERLGRMRLRRAAQMPLLVTAALTCVLAVANVAQNLPWADNLVLFARGVQIAPNNVRANDQLANEQYRRGRSAAALAAYQRALQLDPDDWATNFSLGFTEFELGKYAECESHLQRATDLAPANAAQYYFLAMARMNLGKWDAAGEPLRRGMAVYPGASGLHYAMGLVLAHEGKLPDARQQFEAELRLDPASSAARQGLAQIEKRMAGER